MKDWKDRLPDRPLLTVVEVWQAGVLPRSQRRGADGRHGQVTLWGVRSRIRTGAIPRYLMRREGGNWLFERDKLIEWLGTTNGQTEA